MIVLAPTRFSMRTGWPQSSLILCPMIRASTSEGPPAGNGTTILIGRFGNVAASLSVCCALAASGHMTAPPSAATNVRRLIHASLETPNHLVARTGASQGKFDNRHLDAERDPKFLVGR